MNNSLLNNYALVCGSTQGIGLCVAKELAQKGFNLVLVSRNEKKLKQIISSLPKTNKEHVFVACDFNKPDELKEKISSLIKKHKVTILINNTGGPSSGSILESKKDDFISAFKMHVICSQILTKLVVPEMKKIKFGRIINIISTSVKAPIQNLGVSNTIRGAVANWSKTLANELGEYSVTVNNILPGYTNTKRLESLIQKKSTYSGESIDVVKQKMINSVPAKRFGEPEEIAHLVSFLVSSKAGYINGTNIVVDGGRTASL